MRIGIDLTHTYHRNGGIQRYAVELTRALLKIDTRNEYVLFFRGEIPQALAEINCETKISSIKNQFLNEQMWLPKEIASSKLDVFHSTGFAGPVFYQGNIVRTIHDVSPFIHPETMKLSQFLYWRWLYPLSLRRNENIITDSEHSKADILKTFKVDEKKIFVIPLAPTTIFFNQEENNGEIRQKYHLPEEYFLMVGTLEPRKNYIRLLEAYHRLIVQNNRLPDLLFVGRKGWLYEDILQQISKPDLAGRVHLTGAIPDIDLVQIYRRAKALLYPSLYEGFGLPILEAMSCDCPVLTSNISSMPEVAGLAAEYVDPFSIDSIMQGMLSILQPERRSDLINRGRLEIKRYSWEKTAEKTLKVYQQISI